MLAKPGMGVDEALMIIRNEMSRTLGRIQYKL
jgi:methylaspartate ammonia-lyase